MLVRLRPLSLRSRPAAVLLLAAALVMAVVMLWPAPKVSASTADDEAAFVGLVNGARAGAGKPTLTVSGALASATRQHSASMASSGVLAHTGNLAATAGAAAPGWTALAENVGVGSSVTQIHQALMASSSHRANVLGDYNLLGVGVARSGDGRLWVTELFAHTAAVAAPTPAPAPAPAPAPVVMAETVAAPAPAPVATPVPAPRRIAATAAPAPVAAATPAGESCLPPQSNGHGHAYGRCDQTPQGQANGHANGKKG